MTFRLGETASGVEAIRRACWPKIPHDTRERAVQHLIAQARMDTKNVEQLNIYMCAECHRFHIGHTKADLEKGFSMPRSTYFDEMLKCDVEYDDERYNEQTARRLVRKAATPPRSPQDTSAVSEREELIGQYLHSHPAATRIEAANEVYRQHDGLYERCRLEETVDSHGRALKETYGKATASFGVDARGNIQKAMGDLELEKRVLLVLSKARQGTTYADATAAIFRDDPRFYAEWRQRTYA